jgi:pimeloyl-ACP methyl ester carboxylesterase
MPLLKLSAGSVEYEQFAPERSPGQPIVMLHEGLGSVSMWKDLPQQLARRTASPVTVYSRYGYGRSERLRTPRTTRYMHDEALIVLPEFLDRLQIRSPILFGHSDGASIALLHAGHGARGVAGVIALAPHVFVEDISIESIAKARTAFETTSWRDRLARHHEDVDGAFRGWNDIWLHPDFRTWNIEDCLPKIQCDILVIQGDEDQYGTIQQVQRIARAAPKVEALMLEHCGHSPHADQPEELLAAVARWAESKSCGLSESPL